MVQGLTKKMTLTTKTMPAKSTTKNKVKCLNPWDPQSKRQYQIDGVYCALNAGQAIGGQAHGICYAIEGNVVDRVSAKNGKVWCEDVSPTLNTQDRHAVCYRKTAHPRNSTEGQGYEETTIADTLNVFDSCESRTPVIVLEGNGSRPSHMGNGYSESDTMYTLNTIEQHSVCFRKSCKPYGKDGLREQ